MPPLSPPRGAAGTSGNAYPKRRVIVSRKREKKKRSDAPFTVETSLPLTRVRRRGDAARRKVRSS
jgi:hypothetical protein